MTDETKTKTAEEIAAIELLERLGEYQAQADLLELKRRELLDAVKVPEEVLSAQDEANKRRAKMDADYYQRNNLMRAQADEALQAIVMPELPPEYLAAYQEAQQKRADIEAQLEQDLTTDHEQTLAEKVKIDADLSAQTAKIYQQLAARKSEINGEFEDKASAVKDNIERLTIEAKAAAVKVGHTVRGHVYMAVYVPGRVSWDTAKLDGMCALIPQLKVARKEGAPSVTLRKA